jgi:hypothetical protein
LVLHAHITCQSKARIRCGFARERHDSHEIEGISPSPHKEIQKHQNKVVISIMPRGKNYVNNNNGVALQASAKNNMRLCEYGSGCSRPDCIYRHDNADDKTTEEVCLPFMAGKCSFAKDGCRKRHPKKEELERLLHKYKRTRCRFGDECYTESCLYLHPREMEPSEPYYVEPHDVAFPPLNGAASTPNATKPLPSNSAWKKAVTPDMQQPPRQAPPMQAPPMQAPPMQAPPVQAPPPQAIPSAWYPQGPMCVPYYPGPPNDDMGYYYDSEGHVQGVPPGEEVTAFNADAKEFIPGSNMA